VVAVSAETVEEMKPLLREYVEKSSDIVNLQWDEHVTRKLPFDPYAKNPQIAHYFLMVASIAETELIGRSENARALMIDLYAILGNDLFKPNQSSSFEEHVQKSDTFNQLPTSKTQIPQVLASVNHFVEEIAKGNLIQLAEKFSKPEEMVREVGNNIARMGGRYIDKSWMYMRWMVRRRPDLGVFSNFRSRDLQIPMTSSLRDVAFCLGLCSEPEADLENFEKAEQERQRFTDFAASRDMFPEDPAIVDYPFYVLGRWIHGEQLSIHLLRNHLAFWQRVYARIRRTPLAFDVISRKESSFEQEIRAELERLQFMFRFEPQILNLSGDGGAPQYTPDFVLPSCRKKGKVVILEPHGPWTPLERRMVTISSRSFPIWVYPSQVQPDELRFASKLRAFRKTWGEMYYLVLIVPSTFKDRVERDYPDISDEICEGSDVPKLLYDLKRSSE
jgi:hypothetical protein